MATSLFGNTSSTIGGSGDDTLTGTARSDSLNAGSGADLMIYNISQNSAAKSDVYAGGSGRDTVLIEFTLQQWLLASNQSQIAAYLRHLANVTQSNGEVSSGSASDFTFTFDTSKLKVQMMEKLMVTVDGVYQDPADVACLAVDDTATITEDSGALAIHVLGNDIVPDLVKNVALGTAPIHGMATLVKADPAVPATWYFSYQVNAVDCQTLAAGQTRTDTFSYVVTDADGDASTATVTITITGTNDGPVAVADTAASTENQTVTLDVLANDTDVDDGHVFTLSAASAPLGKGTASVVGNELVFAPGTDFDHLAEGSTEVVHVGYSMQDEFGAVSTAIASITVTGTNDAPLAVADVASGTENEDITIDLLANDTDVDDGHVLTILGALQTSGTSFPAQDVGSNQLVLRVGERFDHLAQGQIEVCEFVSLILDEFDSPAFGDLTVTIVGTNDAPVANADSASGTENQPVTLDVLANDTDVDDGHVFTLTAASAPSGKGSATIEANQLVFSPTDFDHLSSIFSETVTLSYTMQDEFGASSSSTVSVAVSGTNDAPVAIADTAAGSENQTLTINALANDTDVDDFHVFFLNAVSVPSGKGTATIDGDPDTFGNKLLFNPGTAFDHLKQGATETVLASYTMSDDLGASSSSFVTITITGTNDAPVAVADTAEILENLIGVINVLANDTDVDDDHVFTLSAARAPSGKGTPSIDGNQILFFPGTDFDHLRLNATETFLVDYTMYDDGGAESSSSVTITIRGRNDAPVANTDTASGHENQTIAINVLANDTDVDDSSVLTLVSASAPAGFGSASVVGNQVSFTPGTNFDRLPDGMVENVTLDYTMRDQFGATSSSTVNVKITGVNDPAVITGQKSGVVTEAGGVANAIPGQPTATGTLFSADVDNGTGFQQASGNTTYGQFTATAAGTWSYTLDNNNAAVNALNTGSTLGDSFVVRSADGTAQMIAITIQGTTDIVNRAPTQISLLPTYPGNSWPDTGLFANLSTIDPDVGDSHSYSIVDPSGKFKIVGSTIELNSILTNDLNYPLDVTSRDSAGNSLTTQFVVRTLSGGADTNDPESSNDIIFGGGGDDTIDGGGGDDYLFGQGYSFGNYVVGNSLSGGAGNDWLFAVGNPDELTGGAGNDMFVFQEGGASSIIDFQPGDKIVLNKTENDFFFSALSEGALSPTEFGNSLDDGSPVTYNLGNVYYGSTIIASLIGHPALTSEDFLVI